MFGAIMTMNESPVAFYQNVLGTGIDYAVIDQFSLLRFGSNASSIGGLSLQIRANGVEVQSFAPNGVGILGTAIFKVTRP
jgi:hypothetical protein